MTGVMMNAQGKRIMAITLLMVLLVAFLGITMITPARADVFDDIVNVDKDGNVNVGNKVDNTLKLGGTVGWVKTVAQIFTGVCAVIAIIGLVYNFARLSVSAGNEQARKKALTGILWCGISLALFGGLSIVVGFFWNVVPTL